MVKFHFRRRHRIWLVIAGICVLVSLLLPHIRAGFSRLSDELKKQGQYYEPKDLERQDWLEEHERPE